MGLKDVYSPYFKVGAAVPDIVVGIHGISKSILQQFNSLTCENEMKPERVLDMEENIKNAKEHDFSPAFDFSSADVILSFAYNNGIKMRGHTLVWHNQTPEAFFHEEYDCSKPYMSRENMLKRLDGYIKGVITYTDSNYPGLIYAWDVVNEAIEEDGFRPSNWTKIVGEDFVVEAFKIARKYVSPGVKLFYNDYNTFTPWKRDFIVDLILKPLLAENLVDGMGMQTHLTMFEPQLSEYKEALEIYGDLVGEIHVTELDIHNADASMESQKHLALRYKQLFMIFLDAIKGGKANITSVTFWGIHDGFTWLTGFRREKSYPLLFDDCFVPKECYWSTVSVPATFARIENDNVIDIDPRKNQK